MSEFEIIFHDSDIEDDAVLIEAINIMEEDLSQTQARRITSRRIASRDIPEVVI